MWPSDISLAEREHLMKSLLFIIKFWSVKIIFFLKIDYNTLTQNKASRPYVCVDLFPRSTKTGTNGLKLPSAGLWPCDVAVSTTWEDLQLWGTGCLAVSPGLPSHLAQGPRGLWELSGEGWCPGPRLHVGWRLWAGRQGRSGPASAEPAICSPRAWFQLLTALSFLLVTDH